MKNLHYLFFMKQFLGKQKSISEVLRPISPVKISDVVKSIYIVRKGTFFHNNHV